MCHFKISAEKRSQGVVNTSAKRFQLIHSISLPKRFCASQEIDDRLPFSLRSALILSGWFYTSSRVACSCLFRHKIFPERTKNMSKVSSHLRSNRLPKFQDFTL